VTENVAELAKKLYRTSPMPQVERPLNERPLAESAERRYDGSSPADQFVLERVVARLGGRRDVTAIHLS
jgi:hypothetical protein